MTGTLALLLIRVIGPTSYHMPAFATAADALLLLGWPMLHGEGLW